MRSVSQIYSEAITIRNNYLQLTELNTGRSNSKLSMLNLLTYVVAVCIHTYEAVLDLFQVRLAEIINGRINGTPDWYAMMAKKFQYNKVTGTGDVLQFNEDTLKVEYITVDTSKRIIEQAAWQSDATGRSITLKVSKANDNSNEVNNGVPYMPLNDNELTAFRLYIQQIKFVGADIYCESTPGDIISIVTDNEHPIFYNDSYVTAAQALLEIQQALIEFSNDIEYNEIFYYQSVLDVIRKIEHISDIGNGIKIFIKQYNTAEGKYDEPIELTGRIRLRSGFIRWIDENSATTINTDNIALAPASKMNQYESMATI